MRLVDIIKAGRLDEPVWGGVTPPVTWDEWAANFKRDLDETPVLVIDNVAEWASQRDGWDVSDWPTVAPPWTMAWYEFKVPRSHAVFMPTSQVGAMVVAHPYDRQADVEGGWDIVVWPFMEVADTKRAVGPFPVLGARVRRDGTLIDFRADPATPEDEPNRPALIGGVLAPILFAMSFTHCKNVVEEVIEPPPRLTKRHQKRHGKPLTKYRVLQIDPMRELLRTEGRSDEVGVKNALHICRGHFKTYDRKPLFGKVTGTYFWADHVRGDPGRGRVHKDYSIALPGDDGSIEVTVGPTPSWQGSAKSSDAAHRQAVEAFSVDMARKLLEERYAGHSVETQVHSNPGYDIKVRNGQNVVRYVEVKGTTRDDPRFLISEGERLFSLDHGERYTLIVVYDIDLAAETFEVIEHQGAIDEGFQLRPTQWEGVAPSPVA